MELKSGKEMNDDQALSYIRKVYSFNNLIYFVIFLRAIALIFVLLSIMVLTFVIKGENVVSNLVGIALFLGIACALTMSGQKLKRKMDDQVEAVQRGEFQYRIATLTGKHFGSETVGGRSQQLNLLVFQNPENPSELEEVCVDRSFYDGATVGEDMYVVYLPERATALAVKKFV